AAYTAVDNAEDDGESVEKINVLATKYLVDEAEKMDAKFMYISTDYVFSGEGNAPFTTEDMPNPVSVYGKTKLAGEACVDKWNKHFIVRISWVFGVNGNNFIKTMLNLAKTRNEISVVDDQIGSPTYTKDLAKLLISMIQTQKYGLYLASNEGYCSWYEFAQEIFKQCNIEMRVSPVGSSSYPVKAKRPLNSRMDKSKLTESGFLLLPEWKDAVSRYLIEINAK
ncbi:MAG: dTDP-4-dehydrorhamnose reductase, partial [Culicoidibacterales bacterium]